MYFYIKFLQFFRINILIHIIFNILGVKHDKLLLRAKLCATRRPVKSSTGASSIGGKTCRLNRYDVQRENTRHALKSLYF